MGALMGITAINVRTNVIPSYHMRSLGRFQSFSPGLRDGGEIAAAVNWLPGLNDTQGRGAAEWSLLRQATLESNELTKIRVFAPDPDLHMIRVNGFLDTARSFQLPARGHHEWTGWLEDRWCSRYYYSYRVSSFRIIRSLPVTETLLGQCIRV